LRDGYWARTAHVGQLTSSRGGPAKLVLGCCACAALHCGTVYYYVGLQMAATGDRQQKPYAPSMQFGLSLPAQAHTAVHSVCTEMRMWHMLYCGTCPWLVPATSRTSSARIQCMLKAGCSNTTSSTPWQTEQHIATFGPACLTYMLWEYHNYRVRSIQAMAFW